MIIAFIVAREPAMAARWARLGNILFRTKFRDLQGSYALHYAQALQSSGLNKRLCHEYGSRLNSPADPRLRYFLGLAFLFEGHYSNAEHFLKLANRKLHKNEQVLRYLALAKLMQRNLRHAEEIFSRRVKLDPSLVMAHQNLSGRYDRSRYSPPDWELEKAGTLQVYDHLNLFAEQLFHMGKADAAFNAWHKALLHQQELRKNFTLPQYVSDLLKLYPNFDPQKPTAILPYEWVTQLGHIGLLDIFLKIQRHQHRDYRNFVLLAPSSMVANQHYLKYWEQYFIIVRNQSHISTLFPWQRHLGEGFMPYLHDDGTFEPWTRVGAGTQVDWARLRRAPLLKLTDEDRGFGQSILRKLELPNDTWYVGLHVREGGFHDERRDGASEHRNAKIEHYLEAIHEITKAGGWVIRLGDHRMRPLPGDLNNVIDYPSSSMKSDRMDVFLLATSRFILGTTSGLTTAALSFGTPALLVNTISNDWQLWSNSTDFIPKKIYDRRAKRFLTLREVYTTRTRDILINQDLLHRQGLAPIANDSEEIADAVRWKLNQFTTSSKQSNTHDQVQQRFKNAISSEPLIFGAGRIVPTFLLKNPELI